MMTYLILANLSLVLLFGVYMLFLKRLTFFQWNRLYLLAAVAVSFLVPLLQFIDLSRHKEVYQPLTVIDLGGAVPVVYADNEAVSAGWSAVDWIGLAYGVGVVLMLLWMAVRLYRVARMFRPDCSASGSFSFISRVFLEAEDTHREIIGMHERVHVKQGHSYDLLFVEIVRAFNWFNPVFRFYLKELKFQHECIADEKTAEDKVQYAELLVARAMDVSPDRLVHAFSNSSFLKQRIMMLFKNKSKKINQMKYVLILPAALLVCSVTLGFNGSVKSLVDKQVQQLEDLDTSSSGEKNRKSAEPEMGRKAFAEWFVANYKIPGAVDPADKDPFMDVRFDVSETGELSNFERGEGSQFSKPFFDEAVRLILQSKWKPAEKEGKPVASKGWFGFKFDASGKLIKDYTRVDVYPEPKGGLKAWKEYISNGYKFPQEFAEQKGLGEVLVSFIVGKSGEIKEIKTLKEPVAGAGKEAQAIIEKFGEWKPGILDGEGAEYRYQLLIRLEAAEGKGAVTVRGLISERIKA